VTAADSRIARLRGARAPEEPGARGIERVARNPECLRLRALTIVGITPGKAIEILGGVNREGQSPFALVLGQRFERLVLENGAASLLTLYRKEGLLSVTEAKVVDLPQTAPGTGLRARRIRESETARLLKAKLNGDANAPNIIIKPRLFVNLVGVPHAIEPDFLMASDSERFYRAGELKSYPDRGGKTDQADIRSACRQAAVGTVALRQFLAANGVSHPDRIAIAEADLVMRVTGLLVPTLSRMNIESEADSVIRAIAESPTNLDELEALLPVGAALDNAAVLLAVPNRYRSSCKEHCALWERCRAQALADDHPVILGEVAAEKFAAAGSLSRALDLMVGTGAPPRNAAEAALAEELRRADGAFRRAVGGV
jgi:hypothetical protein